jgi:lysophospholipase L1-like esterase
MKFQNISASFALAAVTALAACSSGSSTPAGNTVPPPVPAPASRIVGVGDSLTAGYQSAGWLGAAPGSIANPLCTAAPAPGCAAVGLGVPPGQESGYWAQIWMQANGGTAAQYGQLVTPYSSVLPLISGPGLGNQIVNANPALTGGVPFGTLPTRSGCDSFNQAAYSLNLANTTVRANPGGTVLDLGIPGITLHEAIAMNQPLSPTCVPISSNPLISGLQSLLSESAGYYPVLGGFPSKTTMLQAAVLDKPTIATVWLGANDVLHYAFSGGTFTAVDGIGGNTAQVQQDVTTIVTTLQKAGANVVVANLPDVLKSPFFMSVAPVSPASCTAPPVALTANLTCVLATNPALAPSAATITAQVASAYGLGTTGYVTLGGAITILQAIGAGQTPNLDPNGAGSGLGQNYVTPALATQIQALNDTLNSGINAAATATKVPLVDVHTIFNDLATGCASGCANDPFAGQALTLNPGKCCTLAFGGGLVSFDGLHPSNTGYALIAEAFIAAIDSGYSLTIPNVNLLNQYSGTGTIPFPDPYAQH